MTGDRRKTKTELIQELDALRQTVATLTPDGATEPQPIAAEPSASSTALDRRFADSAPIGMFETDAEGFCTYVNDAWRRIAGISSADAAGTGWAAAIHPDDRETVFHEWSKAADSGTTFDLEYRFQTPRGDITWVACKAAPIKDEAGRVNGYAGTLQDIAERRRALDALSESEEKYRALFENLPTGVGLATEDGRILASNQAVRELYGYSEEEFRETPITSLYRDPDDRDEFVKRLRSEGQVRNFEAQQKRADGTVFDASITTRYVVQKGEKLVLTSIDDITERKMMEQSLREATERYQGLYDNAQVGLFRSRLSDGSFIECNERCAEIFGYEDRETFMSEYITSEHHVVPGTREEMVEEITANGEVVNKEAMLTRRDASVMWVRSSAKAFLADGYLEGVMADITEERRSESELARVKTTLDQALDCIFIFSPDTLRFTYVDRGACDQVGYSEDELRCMTPLDIKPEFTEQLFGEMIAPLLDGTLASHTFQTVHKHKDGTLIPVEVVLQYVAGDGDVGTGSFVAIVRDITDRKRAENLLQEQARANQIMLDAFPCVAFLLRPHTHEIVASNRAALEVGAIPGMTCFGTWGQSETPCPWCMAPEMSATGEEQHEVVEGLGAVWEAHWGPISDDLYMHYAFDITDRTRDEETIRRRLAFEEATSSIAGRFVGVVEMDEALDESLADLGRLTGARRTCVHAFDDDLATMSHTHEWLRDGEPPLPQGVWGFPTDSIPWWMQTLSNGDAIDMPDVDNLPAEAHGEREMLRACGVKSVLALPFSVADELGGYIGIDDPESAGEWSREDLALLRVVSQIIGDAMTRRKADEQLQQYATTQSVLVREVNHRVKNNLTAIIGMLHKEIRQTDVADPAEKARSLRSLSARVEGLCTVHDMLSASEWTPLRLSELCEQVVAGAVESMAEDRPKSLRVTPSHVRVDSSDAHHLALVFNELATNTVKHTAGNLVDIDISVGISVAEETIRIVYRDSGPGYPDALISGDSDVAGGGFSLLRGVVGHSLRGNVRLRNDDGAVAVIIFQRPATHEDIHA